MRRFRSTCSVRLRTPAGSGLLAWVAESSFLRLAGLAFLGDMPDGRGLVLPGCRSVHTVAMRFPIDVAFLTWPPAPGCEVLVLESAVPPLRLVVPRRLRHGAVAALEAPATALADLGLGAGTRLSLDPGAGGDVPQRVMR